MSVRNPRLPSLKLLAPVLASVLGLCTLKLLDPHLVSRQALLHALRPLGPWTPLAYLGLLTIRPVTLLPGQILTALGGVLFGGWKGALYAMLGSWFASSLTFFLGRKFGTRFIRKAVANPDALERAAKENDFLFALVFTLSPVVPTDPILAIAASAGGSYWRTMAGTLLGIIPGTIATAYFGTALSAGHPWVIALTVAGWLVSAVGGVWVGLRVYRTFYGPRRPTPERTEALPAGMRRASQH
ncbi:MAG: TVP38/TMEM64 family protein [Deltaproteobacteria bacterium]|nr:TVP38/TMEM64 family protein [Deltaproteobacteria bacterium]